MVSKVDKRGVKIRGNIHALPVTDNRDLDTWVTPSIRDSFEWWESGRLGAVRQMQEAGDWIVSLPR